MKKMICQICNQETNKLCSHIRSHNISSKEYYDRYLKKENEGVCYCGNNTKFSGLTYGYTKYCSYNCLHRSLETKQKKKETFQKNYGVDNIFQLNNKIKQSYINKLGVENPSQLQNVKNKKNITNLKNIGVDNPSKCCDIKEKKKETFQKHYHVDNCFQSEHIKDKIKKTCINRYGDYNISRTQFFKKKYREICLKKYGVDHYAKTFQFRLFARNKLIERIKRQSGGKIKPQLGNNEQEFFNELQKHISHKLILNEYFHAYYPDARIEEIKTIIEFDERWHLLPKNKERDLKKDEDYKILGYRCIRIKEEDYLKNKDQVMLILTQQLMV